MKILNRPTEAVGYLNDGKIAVLKTDTIYGIVAKASDELAVERIYKVKSRNFRKPCIILVNDIKQIYGQKAKDLASKNNIQSEFPTSMILPASEAPAYLLRGGTSLAYRFISKNNHELCNLISEVGPIVAPSANPEGLKPAQNIQQAIDYFQKNVDIYVDSGEVPADAKPSRIIKINLDGSKEILRG